MKHIIKQGRRLDNSPESWITAAAAVAVGGDEAGVQMIKAMDLLGVRLVAWHLRVLVRRDHSSVVVLSAGRRLAEWSWSSYPGEWRHRAGVHETPDEYCARRARERAERRERAARHDAVRGRVAAELAAWAPARRGALAAWAGTRGSNAAIQEAWSSARANRHGHIDVLGGAAGYVPGQDGGLVRVYDTFEEYGDSVGFGRALGRAVSHVDVDAWEAEVRRRTAERARGVARVFRAIADAAWSAECIRREGEALASVRRLRAVHA